MIAFALIAHSDSAEPQKASTAISGARISPYERCALNAHFEARGAAKFSQPASRYVDQGARFSLASPEWYQADEKKQGLTSDKLNGQRALTS